MSPNKINSNKIIQIDKSLILIAILIGSILLAPYTRDTPVDRKLPNNHNICIVNHIDCGSGDYRFLNTIQCSILKDIKNTNSNTCIRNFQIEQQSLDMLEVPHCYSAKYTDDTDNLEITLTHDEICSLIHVDHPNTRKYKTILYNVTDTGLFKKLENK